MEADCGTMSTTSVYIGVQRWCVQERVRWVSVCGGVMSDYGER